MFWDAEARKNRTAGTWVCGEVLEILEIYDAGQHFLASASQSIGLHHNLRCYVFPELARGDNRSLTKMRPQNWTPLFR